MRTEISTVFLVGLIVTAFPTPQVADFGFLSLNPLHTGLPGLPPSLPTSANLRTSVTLRPVADVFHDLTAAQRVIVTSSLAPTQAAGAPTSSLTAPAVAGERGTVGQLQDYRATAQQPSLGPSASATTPPSPSPVTMSKESSPASIIPDHDSFPKATDDAVFLDKQELENSHRISSFKIIGIVIGVLAGVTLLILFAVNPRVANAINRGRVKGKHIGSRPISSWFPFPAPVHAPPVRTRSRKPVRYEDKYLEHHSSLASPRSKFSVTSSDYSDRSRDSSSSTDTILAKNTRANTSVPPIRPPRPPTADSPTISDDYYLPPENPEYLKRTSPFFDSPTLGRDISNPSCSSMTIASQTPLLSPSLFFTMTPSSSSRMLLSESGLPDPQRPDLHHLRNHSAPVFQNTPALTGGLDFIDPVAKRILKHRRSRSTSGWAYPRKPPSSDESDGSYNGAIGKAL
ncbi:hypothetical protein FA15DRAFT_654284 [Coprinopsis marcescibilis]|uniref:Mid2 domain-containing protein n=1 Tax=Coprinopsis marcescibilis TaxID=230819 RepID=A0A5C3L1S2_COPMA|nr:hypothetical protein FA15DRAFT_654284 [Coprinopsis marcescibilis]